MERDALIERYAKKIFGFACQKSQNRQEAEDLSQSILAKLCEVPWEKKAIADMDGYIYRICLNTYYTRQRKEARYWTCVDYDALPERPDDGRTPEEAFLLGEDLRKLRREVMRLCRLRREAIVLFYYEHKSSREIAARLGVPESTLRWHLGEARHRLKERMDMKDTVFEPIRLQVYICGNGNDPEMSGLRHDLLTQNICIACADSPKRVEEIAARLGTAAAFIESRLPALVQAGYLQSAGGKYRTTFFIADAPFITKLKAFERKLLAPAAEALGKAARKVLPQVREIGFEGSGLDEALLLWDVAAIAAHTFMNGIANFASAEPPVRGDGSRHWVLASWTDEEVLRRCTLTPEERAYLRCAGGMAGKHSGDGKTTVQQFDPPAATADRAFCTAGRVRALRREVDPERIRAGDDRRACRRRLRGRRGRTAEAGRALFHGRRARDTPDAAEKRTSARRRGGRRRRPGRRAPRLRQRSAARVGRRRRTRIPAFALLRAERDALPRRTAVPHGRTEAGLLHRGLRTHLTKPGFFAILSKKDRRFLYDRFPSRTL